MYTHYTDEETTYPLGLRLYEKDARTTIELANALVDEHYPDADCLEIARAAAVLAGSCFVSETRPKEASRTGERGGTTREPATREPRKRARAFWAVLDSGKNLPPDM